MNLSLAALGMLACIAIMAVVVPLGGTGRPRCSPRHGRARA